MDAGEGFKKVDDMIAELDEKEKKVKDVEKAIKDAQDRGDKGHKVRDHCHISGKYRGAAHSVCNFKLQLQAGKTCIPVIFHNLQGYDSHFIIQEIGKVGNADRLHCIPRNFEKFIAFLLYRTIKIY